MLAPFTPDLASFDTIILAFSGGKDSIACLLSLIEAKAPFDRVELHHHAADGEGPSFIDLPSTTAYCRALARAFDVPRHLSWKEGGFLHQMLRTGKTPSGPEIRNHLRRLVRRIRQHWPTTRITIRGDGHYGRHEVMTWCEASDVDYILGLPGNAVLDRLVERAADAVRVRRAEDQSGVVRGYTETRYGAKSWGCQRRVAARIEATTRGLDIRYVVTNIHGSNAAWLYDDLYCARGQAENLIKLHKAQLASDRTSCRSPLANQVRLILHTGAYWLMFGLRDAIPYLQPLATAEFTTLRLRLIKIAARVTETASRVRLAFAAACPEAALFTGLARSLQPAGP